MARSKLHVNNTRKTENVTKIWFDIDLRAYVRIIRSVNILYVEQMKIYVYRGKWFLKSEIV